MKSSSILALASAASVAFALPQEKRQASQSSCQASTVIPVQFSTDLATIQRQAHGTLPNIALPTSISDLSATVWQLIAFNELFEVKYFESLIVNITAELPGYEVDGDKDFALEALYAVHAQEQLHAIAANAVLSTAGRTTIQPCNYSFPVASYDDAIAFAYTFTDIVLGTLGEAATAFGTDGDSEFLGILSSVIAQEGEQNGWYRSILSKIPSALPFLSASSAAFAYSALNQLVVVPGSCPNANVINIPILQPLTISTPNVGPTTTSINFSVAGSVSGMSIVYINQQNTPIVETISNVQTANGVSTFTAAFPYDQYLMNGLTIAALANGTGPFASAGAVASASSYGPGIIEIN